MDLDLTVTCSRMPNQIEGTFNSHEVYFRARHGDWVLRLNHQIIAHGSGDRLGPHGEEPGWWTPEDALRFVEEQLHNYMKCYETIG